MDIPEGCGGKIFNLLTAHMFNTLTQSHAMSDLCKATGTKSRNISTLLDAEFPALLTDPPGRCDKLISCRTISYVQANILLAAPFQSPRDELFQRATSFQESLEEEMKTEYKTKDVSSHPDYRRELLALLSTYYEDLLDLKGACGVAVTRTLALH